MPASKKLVRKTPEEALDELLKPKPIGRAKLTPTCEKVSGCEHCQKRNPVGLVKGNQTGTQM